MQFLIILALIGLSSQLETDLSYQYSTIFPLKAVAVLHGETQDPVTNETCRIYGSVKFEQLELVGNVTITVDIFGLPLQAVQRGLHIHTYGILNVTNDAKSTCASTGPHYNPLNETHGILDSEVRHIGDLGNVMTFENGTIRAVLVSNRLELYGPYSIIGRSVVLHQSEDDGGMGTTELSRTAGSSGARIACGVIGLDKSSSGAVENGFFSYFAISSNVTMNQTDIDPSKLFFGFEDSQDSSPTNQLKNIFYNILSNSLNSLKSVEGEESSNVAEPIDEFALLRRKLIQLL